MIALLLCTLAAWFLHVQFVKRRAKRDMLDLIALQLKATGRTPWRA